MKKAPILPSAMISFTQIGWFGVGLAMFAIPVARRDLPRECSAAQWSLVILAGVCMTASAYFGIEVSDPGQLALQCLVVAVLGTVAMVMAVRQGDGTIIDQFASLQRVLKLSSAAPVLSSAPSYRAERPHRTSHALPRMRKVRHDRYG